MRRWIWLGAPADRCACVAAQHPYAVPGGILLAYLADPLVDRLGAGLSRTWGVVVVFACSP
jgi:hypothetical protein